MSAHQSLPLLPLTHWLRAQNPAVPEDIALQFLLRFQSNHTRRGYFSDINSFFLFWRERGSALPITADSITEKHVLLWLEQFRESSTRGRKLASLSSFFNFCLQRGRLTHNPCRLVKRPKISAGNTTQALDEKETLALLTHLRDSAYGQMPSGAHAQRKLLSARLRFAVLHTLFSVGMRVDELCELRVSDLLFQAPHFRLRFISKGGEENVKTVSEGCAAVISEYLQQLRQQPNPDDFVFTRVQGTQKKVKLSQTAVFKMISSAAREAGLNKSLSPHSARATVATVLHRQGVPLGFIQSLLNHRQITTTAHYVKKANERSESAALKAPVAQWLGEDE